MGAVTAAVVAAAIFFGGEVLAVAAMVAVTLPVIAVRLPVIVNLERELRYGPIGRVDLAGAVFYYMVAIPLAVRGAGAWALAIATLGREVLVTIALLALVPSGRVMPRLDFSRVRPVLGFGIHFQAVGIVQAGRDQGLAALTAGFGNLTVLGYSSVLTKLLALPMVIVQPLWRVAYASYARLVPTNDNHARLLERSFLSLIAPVGVVCAILGASAKPLVAVIFGPQWAPTASAVPWAVVGFYLFSVTTITCTEYLFAIGRARTVLWSAVVQAAAMMLAVVLLVPSLGIVGVGISILANGVVQATVLGVATRRASGARLLRSIVASGVVVATAAFCGSLVGAASDHGLVGIVVTGAAGAAIFVLGTLVTIPAAVTFPFGLARRFWAERYAV